MPTPPAGKSQSLVPPSPLLPLFVLRTKWEEVANLALCPPAASDPCLLFRTVSKALYYLTGEAGSAAAVAGRPRADLVLRFLTLAFLAATALFRNDSEKVVLTEFPPRPGKLLDLFSVNLTSGG